MINSRKVGGNAVAIVVIGLKFVSLQDDKQLLNEMDSDDIVVIGLKFVSLQDDKQHYDFLFASSVGCDWIKIRIFAR